MSEIETLAQSKHFEEYLQQLGYVKVTYCKECIWYDPKRGYCDNSHSLTWQSFDYCSDAERKTE